jgi:hypothetical protein
MKLAPKQAAEKIDKYRYVGMKLRRRRSIKDEEARYNNDLQSWRHLVMNGCH